jgi:hypothetical protein
MKIRHRFLCSFFFAASLAGAAAAQGPEVLKLEPYRRGVAIRVEAGGKPGLFTLDTAGGITSVSPDYARAAGCKPWGQLVGFQMTGNRLAEPRCDAFAFTSGGVKLAVPVAGVLDVTPYLAKDAKPVDGSLALDAFVGRTITIDFAAGELVLETADSVRERMRGARELPIHLSREVGGLALTPLIDVPTKQGVLRFELDSGNGGTLLVSKPYAALFGLKTDAEGPQTGSIPIADGVVATGLVFTPDMTIDGNLGMPFLKDWAITLDLAEGRMWIKPSRATPPPGMGVPPTLPNG